MIQRGSDTSFTNLWSLLLYLPSLLHYIENAQENKKNTILLGGGGGGGGG